MIVRIAAATITDLITMTQTACVQSSVTPEQPCLRASDPRFFHPEVYHRCKTAHGPETNPPAGGSTGPECPHNPLNFRETQLVFLMNRHLDTKAKCKL